MPYIRFTGFESAFLRELAHTLVERFSDISNSPQHVIKIERTNIEPILNSPRTVEISMFQREKSVHDAIALMIHNLLQERGFADVHIFFRILTPSLYYKNGVPVNYPPRRTSNVT